MSTKVLCGLVVVGALVWMMPGASWADPPSLEETVADLQARVEALEAGLPMVGCLTTQPGPGLEDDVVFEGCNVHIRNSSGSTEIADGTGNLIVGYNEDESPALNRSGSHNLVLGSRNAYSSFGGFVMGILNAISGPYATVTGGVRNIASGERASVNGGADNHAEGRLSVVNGGINNTASGYLAVVTGGENNMSSGVSAVVTGGLLNTASGRHASVGGGRNNVASGLRSTVSGGLARTASGNDDWRAGSLFEDF